MAAQWSVEFSAEAERDLAKLDRQVRRRIIDKLYWLQEHFDAIIPTVLSGEYREFYKLRAGDWRVAYKINWNHRIIIVSYVEHRSRMYRRRR